MHPSAHVIKLAIILLHGFGGVRTHLVGLLLLGSLYQSQMGVQRSVECDYAQGNRRTIPMHVIPQVAHDVNRARAVDVINMRLTTCNDPLATEIKG